MGAADSDHRQHHSAERYSIAVITFDEQMFRDMRRSLAQSFHATLASTEAQITTLMDDPDLHGIVLDLESIGEGAADGIEVLQEMRRHEAAIESLFAERLKIREAGKFSVNPRDGELGPQIVTAAKELKLAPEALVAALEHAGVPPDHFKAYFRAELEEQWHALRATFG